MKTIGAMRSMGIAIRRASATFLTLLWIAILVLRGWSADPESVLNREPFDRLILSKESGGSVLEIRPLDNQALAKLADHKPEEKLRVELVRIPDQLFEIEWKHVERVEAYRDIVAAELRRQIERGAFEATYREIMRLHQEDSDSPQVRGLMQEFLIREAIQEARQGRYLESLAGLMELRRQDPQNAIVAKKALEIFQLLLDRQIKAMDYAEAWQTLTWIRKEYAQLVPAPQSSEWEGKLRSAGQQHVALAIVARKAENYLEALLEIRVAVLADPDSKEAVQLQRELVRDHPVVTVAATSNSPQSDQFLPLDWASMRVFRLKTRTILEQTGLGSDGGEYRFPLGTFQQQDKKELSGLELVIDADLENKESFPNAFDLADCLLHPIPSVDSAIDIASRIALVKTEGPQRLQVTWAARSVKPDRWLTWLAIPGGSDAWNPSAPYLQMAPKMRDKLLAQAKSASMGAMQAEIYSVNEHYALRNSQQPLEIVEQFADSHYQALAELLRGRVDIVDRIQPMEALALRENPSVVVGDYAVPSVHLLVPNMGHPRSANRTFRRGLLYAIDRAKILNEVLLGGFKIPGCEIISAPIPKGIGFEDPIGYAYDSQVKPLTTDRALGLTLCRLGMGQVAAVTPTAQSSKTSSPSIPPATTSSQTATTESAAEQTPAPKSVPEATATATAIEPVPGVAAPLKSTPSKVPTEAVNEPPLIIAVSSGAFSRNACEAVVDACNRLGIRTELREFPRGVIRPPDDAWDFWYCNLVMTEPYADVQVLLEPGLFLSETSSYVALALQRVQEASSWEEARSALHALHRILFDEVTVLPLWQIKESYATRSGFKGIGPLPLSLYQNVEDWRLPEAEGVPPVTAKPTPVAADADEGAR